MAYNSGTILDADPATLLIAEIEDTLNDHTGNWEFVEQVAISSVNYRVWKNAGSGVTNPNSWGADFFFAINRQSATEIRVTVFEVWDATNKKAIRPCRQSSSAATPNANTSFGDETNGFVLNVFGTNTTSLTYVGLTGLTTTGFSWYCQATKDRLYLSIKQGTTDDCFQFGVFESLLTTSPAELFPLYMCGSGSLAQGNLSNAGRMAWSRHPGAAIASSSSNWHGGAPNTSLITPMGGVGNAAAVDRFHNNSWLAPRPLVYNAAGSTSDGAAFGFYRGILYDAIIMASSGATTRNGDTVTLSGDVYVKMSGSGWTHWVKRDAT